jgi:hypothetical protein
MINKVYSLLGNIRAPLGLAETLQKSRTGTYAS